VWLLVFGPFRDGDKSSTCSLVPNNQTSLRKLADPGIEIEIIVREQFSL
jgi:hypothetical protein